MCEFSNAPFFNGDYVELSNVENVLNETLKGIVSSVFLVECFTIIIIRDLVNCKR